MTTDVVDLGAGVHWVQTTAPKALVRVFCPSRRRCGLGGVYRTQRGRLLLTGEQTGQAWSPGNTGNGWSRLVLPYALWLDEHTGRYPVTCRCVLVGGHSWLELDALLAQAQSRAAGKPDTPSDFRASARPRA